MQNNTLKKIIFVGTGILLAGCSTSTTPKFYSSYYWHEYKDSTPNLEQPIDNNLIVVRDESITKKHFVNFFVNDHYVASLHKYGYKQIETCGGKQKVTATLNDFKTSKVIASTSQYIDFSKAKYTVVKASERNNKPQISLIDTKHNQAYLSQLKEQNHTISRARLADCAVPALPVIDKYHDVLFKFDGYSPNTIIAQGRLNVLNIAKKIKGDRNKQIQLLGYTDPMGTKQYNLELSKKRALTVKELLVSAGVSPAQIKSDGFGFDSLVTTTCNVFHNSKDRNLCNQANRRVKINIIDTTAK